MKDGSNGLPGLVLNDSMQINNVEDNQNGGCRLDPSQSKTLNLLDGQDANGIYVGMN